MNLSLTMYCYFESQEAVTNLKFFIKNGVFDKEEYYYVFIINNAICSVEIPPFKNVCCIYRSDNSSDISTYRYAFEILGKRFIDRFQYIYFINSSCIGPFLSNILEGYSSWIELMNFNLQTYDMVGPILEVPTNSVNVSGDSGFTTSETSTPFIHSYMFGTNKRGLQSFIDVIMNISRDKLDAIISERLLTLRVLESGGKIKSLLSRFRNIDINDRSIWYPKLHTDSQISCYEVPGNYFGINVNPFEIMFIKNIRNTNAFRNSISSGIDPVLKLQIDKYVEWI